MSQAPAKILIVDDEEQNLRFFEDALTLENYSIAKARDGFEALDLFEKYQPDLILLDLMMPRLNGYEVCSRLKHNARAQFVPVIMLSGYTEPEARTRALALGADDFLSKPVDRVELMARIHSLLHPRRCRACLADVTVVLNHLEQAQAHLDVHPDAALSPLVSAAMAGCKRLDRKLKRL